jgi:hypothetical protein
MASILCSFMPSATSDPEPTEMNMRLSSLEKRRSRVECRPACQLGSSPNLSQGGFADW